MRAWAAGLWLLLGCIEDKLVPCGDELCPRDTLCRTLTNPEEGFCATTEQVAACEGFDEAAACDGGWCHDGVCLPIVCGNQRVDLGEACDDGNTVTGDGVCSGDCTSDETCGNGSVDPIRMVGSAKDVNEQCDDGNLASGDGCSSSCQNETALWSLVDTTPVPALGDARAALDTLRGRVVLFGGVDTDSKGNRTTFEWDGSSWSRVASVSAPLARTGHAMAFDAARRRVVLFGGYFENDDNPYADTWTWDGQGWRNESPVSVPSARLGAAMAYDGARERIVLFGGLTSSTKLADTWEWDGTNWTEVVVPAPPPARANAAMTYDARRGRIVMVGGHSLTAAPLHETWEYDGTTWTKSAATTPTDIYGTEMLTFDGTRVVGYGFPSGNTYEYDGVTWTSRGSGALPPRRESVLVGDPRASTLVVFGGVTDVLVDETWVYAGGTWTQHVAPLAPTARAGSATAYDEKRGISWMFGGDQTNGVFTNEMWSFDGVSRWRLASTGGPSGRTGSSMAYDRRNDRVVMFGGAVASFAVVPSETWVWDGETWTKATPVHSPPPRALASMVYDPRINRVVLIGGIGPGLTPSTLSTLNDRWEWDGVDWTDVTPSDAPYRYGAAAAYDETRGDLLLLHGARVDEASFTIFNDMWSFDGSTWSSAATPLPSRGAGTFHYDRTRRVTTAFAGGNQMADYDDTWEWNGATWQRLNVVPPPARARHATMTAVGGGFVVFAGMRSFAFLDDAWRLAYANDESRESCVSSAIDNDGDGLAGCADDDCWLRCSPQCAPGTACPGDALRCGDGACNEALEDCRLCPDDCGACTAACGDAVCDVPETPASCPGDCP